tara:strand:- start:2381 stop:2548 length:168 start_codon:yes stop_codon:yes gene_type:complete
MKTLYELELHEIIDLPSGLTIMRVPGGWIYDCWDYEVDKFKSGTFVPFNNDFKRG